jgi:hypothetical protein
VDQSLTPEECRWTACLYAVPNLPIVVEGDDVAHLIFSAATEDRFVFRDDDVVVVTQKIATRRPSSCPSSCDVRGRYASNGRDNATRPILVTTTRRVHD